MSVCLHVYLCTVCMPDTSGGQKRVSDPQGLESQIVLSLHVSARNQILVLCRYSVQPVKQLSNSYLVRLNSWPPHQHSPSGRLVEDPGIVFYKLHR